jgi:hypothetical protein
MFSISHGLLFVNRLKIPIILTSNKYLIDHHFSKKLKNNIFLLTKQDLFPQINDDEYNIMHQTTLKLLKPEYSLNKFKKDITYISQSEQLPFANTYKLHNFKLHCRPEMLQEEYLVGCIIKYE